MTIPEGASGNRNYGTADDLTANTSSPQQMTLLNPKVHVPEQALHRKSVLSKDICMSLPANFDQQEVHPPDSTV